MSAWLRRAAGMGLVALGFTAGTDFSGVAGTFLAQHPDAIVCDIEPIEGRSGGKVILYLAGKFDDGKVVYHTVGRLNIVVVFEDGGNRVGGALAICDGKGLVELEREGRTFNFGE